MDSIAYIFAVVFIIASVLFMYAMLVIFGVALYYVFQSALARLGSIRTSRRYERENRSKPHV